jgi:hypothetical protein
MFRTPLSTGSQKRISSSTRRNNENQNHSIIYLKRNFMSKAILFILIFFTGLVTRSSASDTLSKVPTDKPYVLSTLIINANVTVVLVDNPNGNVQMVGNDFLSQHITFTQKGDTLTIGQTKNKDFTNAGIIYVPANQLKKIHVNNIANVRSLHFVQITKLDVVVNSICRIAIANIGQVNLIETEDYFVEESREVRHLPAGLVRPYAAF